MDKKEILERQKKLVLEMYELDAQLAPCLKSFESDEDSFEFILKENFTCDGCVSNTCFVNLEKGEYEDRSNPMYV